VVAADGEADFAVHFEAAGGGQEAEGWRAEWVGRWEHYAAVVDAAFVGRGGGRAFEREVPFEEVVF
jgi:hypothetical protein